MKSALSSISITKDDALAWTVLVGAVPAGPRAYPRVRCVLHGTSVPDRLASMRLRDIALETDTELTA